MYGIYINCSGGLPFIAWILSGAKLYETRKKDVLRALVGLRVYLIETGTGPVPMVRGSAVIASAERIGRENRAARDAAMITGTPYDIQPGAQKVFYLLRDVRPCEPFPAPAGRVNTGRSYTRF